MILVSWVKSSRLSVNYLWKKEIPAMFFLLRLKGSFFLWRRETVWTVFSALLWCQKRSLWIRETSFGSEKLTGVCMALHTEVLSVHFSLAFSWGEWVRKNSLCAPLKSHKTPFVPLLLGGNNVCCYIFIVCKGPVKSLEIQYLELKTLLLILTLFCCLEMKA